MGRKSIWRLATLVLVAAIAVGHGYAADTCRRVVLEGEAGAGQEWKSAIGEGWVFRLVPVPPLEARYSGWDLVVDRAQPAGFPDALYLATPPYQSINEREIGTTYELRAQDAIGWNPRSFRFLTNAVELRQAQQLYLSTFRGGNGQPPDSRDLSQLLEVAKHSAAGELRIMDAHLAPGVADPAPFAQRWAMAAGRTQHEIEAAADGKVSARGSLLWMRFSITLWLPANWALPAAVHGTNAVCGR